MTDTKTPPKKRPAPAGMRRISVLVTEEHCKALEAEAKAENPVFPREINEHLSAKIHKAWESTQPQANNQAIGTRPA